MTGKSVTVSINDNRRGTRSQETKSELKKKFEASHSHRHYNTRPKDTVPLKWMEVQIMVYFVGGLILTCYMLITHSTSEAAISQ